VWKKGAYYLDKSCIKKIHDIDKNKITGRGSSLLGIILFLCFVVMMTK
jgi:hypothetical protein